MLEGAKNYNRYLLKQISGLVPSRAKVLDFGAGTGHFALELKRLGHTVIAVEADHVLGKRIADRGITCAQLDTLEDDSFDLVFSINVLEHIRDDESTLRTLANKLRPGGKLFIYVPAHPELYSTFDEEVGHHRRYTKRDLQELASQTELAEIEIRSHDFLGYSLAKLYKLVSRAGVHLSRSSLYFYDRFVFPLSLWLERTISPDFRGKNLSLSAKRSMPTIGKT